MDTKARAGKIVSLFGQFCMRQESITSPQINTKDLIDSITTQLDEAVEEAKVDWLQNNNLWFADQDVAWKSGYAAARDQAAGIADCYLSGEDDNTDKTIDKIAERIRAMEAGK